MKTTAILSLVLLCLIVAAAPVSASRNRLYVDDDLLCAGRTPCFEHPQDAVNTAKPGQTIEVYPGTYGSRRFTSPTPPHSDTNPNNQYAPALIVYKDRLTIKAVDKDPSLTVIEATHRWWSNPVAVQASTGGVWNATTKEYEHAGVNPVRGSAPNAISIIANSIRIEGFTIRRPYDSTAGGHSAALIGGLFEGYGLHDGEIVGFSGNTIKNNVFDAGGSQAPNGIVIWHSYGNRLYRNEIIDPRQAAIRIYDGWTEETVKLQPPSQKNVVRNNKIVDDPATAGSGQAIFVGAWYDGQPNETWTDNTGTRVVRNDCGGMILFTAYSSGRKLFSGNKNVGDFRAYEASDFKYRGSSINRAASGLFGLATGTERGTMAADPDGFGMTLIPHGPPPDQIVEGF